MYNMNYIKFKNGTHSGKAFGLTRAQQQLTIEQLHALDIYQCILIKEHFDAMFYQLSEVKSSIAGGVVTLENVIVERSVEAIQFDLYAANKRTRDGMAFGDLTVEGVTIIVADMDDVQVVTLMGDTPIRYKRGTRDRVNLTAEQALEFNRLFKAKIQANFDWEEAEEDKVFACTTHAELAAYAS